MRFDLYISHDTEPDFARLRARLAKQNMSLSQVLCTAIRDLARYREPAVIATQRLLRRPEGLKPAQGKAGRRSRRSNA